MKQNCWEFKQCGREPGGTSAQRLGVCPASTECRLNGVHEGKNGGRACWVVAGTCGGTVQGSFGLKYKDCEVCDFYKTTKVEEKNQFQISLLLLNRLRSCG